MEDDSPNVIGGQPSPMPTEDDRKAAWKRIYVAKFVAVGLDAETAESWFDELNWDEAKDEDPEDMANDEMEYWTDDE
jgi:hypothetical protein